jgi:ABC-type Zn uptake system ZnuABC Zn-binding protein ZnuA
LLGAAAILAPLALVAAGCGDDSSGEGSGTSGAASLEVVATTMQLQDFTRRVGGDRVAVTGILGPDSEPHEYEPTPDDADALSSAQVIVENGANLDEWLADLLENAPDDAVVVTAVDGIELLPTDEEGFPGDPHVWHDPALAARMVDNIAAGLSEADPGGAAAYRANAERYTAELEAMAAEIERIFAPVPEAERLLVTSHDAFSYFARAFGITQVGSVLPSVTTETEPSAQQVQELVDEIREAGVTVIFTEEAVDPRLEEQVADEAGATVDASLFADVLGEPGSEGATYIDAQIANARAMARAWTAS